jgi:RNA recognition motif-containing protein
MAEYKLFVCNIGKSMTSQDLQAHFAQFGEVTDSNVVLDKMTGQAKGFGFISYRFQEQAQAAIDALHEKFTFPGNEKPVIVRFKDERLNPNANPASLGIQSGGMGMPYGYPPAPPHVGAGESYKLFVCHLPKAMTIEELRAVFVPFGEIAECNIVKDKDTGEGKGYGFVAFRHASQAQAAIMSLHEKRTFPGNEKPVIVRFKDENKFPAQPPMGYMGQPYYPPMMPNPMDPYGMAPQPYQYYPTAYPPAAPVQQRPQIEGPPGANLFVCYLPMEMMDEQLAAIFGQYGNLLTCKIHRDHSGLSKGYGWVNYDNPQAAANAMTSLNGLQVGMKRIRVQIHSKERTKPY